MATYIVRRPDGSVEYTDRPGGPGTTSTYRPGANASDDDSQDDGRKPYDPKLAEKLIKEARKRIPKINDYLEYVDYLRNRRPWAFERMLEDLRRTDPQTWTKLQAYPQFRPLHETAIGWKAGEKNLSAMVGLASGNFTGSAEKWIEATLKDMMKRDRFGPYAEVLGSKATTLATNQPTYSNSRLGQHLRSEGARAAKATHESARDLESARAGLRAAKGAAVVRSMGPLVDLGIGMLNPDMVGHAASAVVEKKLKAALSEGLLDEDQYVTAHNLMATGRY